VQLELPSLGLKYPGVQEAQKDADFREYVPAGHVVHVVADTDPIVDDAFPAKQPLQ
jgi:hypothetical protein